MRRLRPAAQARDRSMQAQRRKLADGFPENLRGCTAVKDREG